MKHLFPKIFFEYAWDGFTALILWWIPIILFFGWGGLLSLMFGDYSLAFYELSIVLFPIPLLLLCYFADRYSKNIFVRGFIIYGFWCIVAFVTCYVFTAVLGGFSVEGSPLSFSQRNSNYLVWALQDLVWLQPIIIILTVIGTYRIRKVR